jgi:hypothetical protein
MVSVKRKHKQYIYYIIIILFISDMKNHLTTPPPLPSPTRKRTCYTTTDNMLHSKTNVLSIFLARGSLAFYVYTVSFRRKKGILISFRCFHFTSFLRTRTISFPSVFVTQSKERERVYVLFHKGSVFIYSLLIYVFTFIFVF